MLIKISNSLLAEFFWQTECFPVLLKALKVFRLLGVGNKKIIYNLKSQQSKKQMKRSKKQPYESYIFKCLRSDNYSIFEPSPVPQISHSTPLQAKIKSYSQLIAQDKGRLLQARQAQKSESFCSSPVFDLRTKFFSCETPNRTIRSKSRRSFPSNPSLSKLFTTASLIRTENRKSEIRRLLQKNRSFEVSPTQPVIAGIKEIISRQKLCEQLSNQAKHQSTEAGRLKFKIKKRKEVYSKFQQAKQNMDKVLTPWDVEYNDLLDP